MAFRTWVRLLGATLGMAALAGACQLGVAYGLGILRLTRVLDVTTRDQWTAQLAWVAWFAMMAAVIGAFAGSWLLPRWSPTRPGTGAAAAIAVAAGVGAAVVVPLTMQPARTAQIAGVHPVFVIGLCAALGALAGVFAAIAAQIEPVSRASLAALGGAVWLIAIVSVVPSLAPDDPLPSVRLGVFDAGFLSPGVTQRTALFTMPAIALIAGALLGWAARRLGKPMLTVALAGLPGPALLTVSYLIAGPGSGADRYQVVPYWAAMTATGAGVLGSVLAAVVRRGGPEDGNVDGDDDESATEERPPLPRRAGRPDADTGVMPPVDPSATDDPAGSPATAAGLPPASGAASTAGLPPVTRMSQTPGASFSDGSSMPTGSHSAGPTTGSLSGGPTPTSPYSAGPTPVSPYTAGPTPVSPYTAGPTPVSPYTAGPTPMGSLPGGLTPAGSHAAGATPGGSPSGGMAPAPKRPHWWGRRSSAADAFTTRSGEWPTRRSQTLRDRGPEAGGNSAPGGAALSDYAHSEPSSFDAFARGAGGPATGSPSRPSGQHAAAEPAAYVPEPAIRPLPPGMAEAEPPARSAGSLLGRTLRPFSRGHAGPASGDLTAPSNVDRPGRHDAEAMSTMPDTAEQPDPDATPAAGRKRRGWLRGKAKNTAEDQPQRSHGGTPPPFSDLIGTSSGATPSMAGEPASRDWTSDRDRTSDRWTGDRDGSHRDGTSDRERSGDHDLSSGSSLTPERGLTGTGSLPLYGNDREPVAGRDPGPLPLYGNDRRPAAPFGSSDDDSRRFAGPAPTSGPIRDSHTPDRPSPPEPQSISAPPAEPQPLTPPVPAPETMSSTSESKRAAKKRQKDADFVDWVSGLGGE